MTKIVSLAPNITNILYELDVRIAGCTGHTNKGERTVGEWMAPNYGAVREIEPDVVFTSDGLQEEVRRDLEQMDFKVHHTEPRRFDDLFDLIEEIGTVSGAESEASQLNDRLLTRVYNVKEYVKNRDRIGVYSEEWDSPPMAAGNWVPDMIEIAGGAYPFVESGDRSTTVTEEQYNEHEPDVFLSHICGGGEMESFRDFRDEWDLPDRVYFVDDSVMNQLSPNTVDGIENLAAILHDYPNFTKRFNRLR